MKRVLSIALVFVMILTMIPLQMFTAIAEDDTPSNGTLPQVSAVTLEGKDLEWDAQPEINFDFGFSFIPEHTAQNVDAFAAGNPYADYDVDIEMTANAPLELGALTLMYNRDAWWYPTGLVYDEEYATDDECTVWDGSPIRILHELGSDFQKSYTNYVKTFENGLRFGAIIDSNKLKGVALTFEMRLYSPQNENDSILLATWNYNAGHEHNYQSVVTAPTCTDQGYTTYTCADCGDSYTEDYTAALGHDFGAWAVTTPEVLSTATQTGTTAVETRTCSRCDAAETRGGETTPALGEGAMRGYNYEITLETTTPCDPDINAPVFTLSGTPSNGSGTVSTIVENTIGRNYLYETSTYRQCGFTDKYPSAIKLTVDVDTTHSPLGSALGDWRGILTLTLNGKVVLNQAVTLSKVGFFFFLSGKLEVSVPAYDVPTIVTTPHTVRFKNADGTVEQSILFAEGEMPYYWGATKDADAQYSYTFAGWDPEIVPVTEDAVYTASFDATVNEYTITFKDGNGNVLKTSKLPYGETPVYDGAEPTKSATQQYTYTFSGWTPEIVPVSGDKTYTANFNSTLRNYTIRFLDEDGTQLQSSQVAYGSTPAYNGTTPTKAATAQYSYTFNGWSPSITSVTKNQDYTATYTATGREYTVTFIDASGMHPFTVAYGETPVAPAVYGYEDGDYDYSFAGWDKDVVPVTGDATYTARYSSTFISADYTEYYNAVATAAEKRDNGSWTEESLAVLNAALNTDVSNKGRSEQGVVDAQAAAINAAADALVQKVESYTIRFVDEDGTELQSGSVEAGETPVYNGETPTKEATAAYTYTFAGWSPEIAPVSGDTTYTATYTQTARSYTIRFVDEGGTELQSSQMAYGETPVYTGSTPEKMSDGLYTYTFAGWSPEVAPVSGDTTYTATFSQEHIHQYAATVTAPTCTEGGYTTYTCTQCDDSYVADYTDALGHDFGAWAEVTAAVPATATTDGSTAVEQRSCSRCDATETRGGEVIPATGAAVEDDSGEYYVRVTYKVTKSGTFKANYGGFNTEVDDSAGISLLYKDVNGTAADYKVQDWDIKSSMASNGTYTADATVSGFPYLLYGYADDNRFGGSAAEFTINKLEVGSSASDLQEVWNGNIQLSTILRGFGLSVDWDDTQKADYFDRTDKDNFINSSSGAWEKPYAATMHSAYAQSEVRLNAQEDAISNSLTYEALDQYGVKMGSSLCTVTTTDSVSDNAQYIATSYEGGSGQTTVQKAAHLSGEGNNSQTIVATCAWAGKDTTQSDTAQFTLLDEQYTITWLSGGDTLSEKFVCYGDTPVYDGTQPTQPADEMYTYTFDGWSPDIMPATQDTAYTAVFSQTHEHHYGAVVTAPTCTEQGYTTYTCTAGDDSYVDNYTDALGHDFGAWSVTTPAVPATATEAGSTAVETRTCSRCDATETRGGEVIPATGGETPIGAYTYEVTIETTNAASIQGTPNVTMMGKLLGSETEQEMFNEDVGSEFFSTKTTYTKSGFDNKLPSKLTINVPLMGVWIGTRTWVGIVTVKVNNIVIYSSEHTIESSNSENVIVIVFDSSYINQIINGGSYNTFNTVRYLNDDGTVLQEGSYPPGTTPEYTGTTPTKPDSGDHRYFFEGWAEEVDSVTGNITFTARYHDCIGVKTEPTCTEQGYTTYTCTELGCDFVRVVDYVDALGHNFSGWVVTKHPTVNEEGSREHRCYRCGLIESESIPPLASDLCQTKFTVIDAITGNPLNGALITVYIEEYGAEVKCTTNASGKATTGLPEGRYQTSVAKEGYKTRNVYIDVNGDPCTIPTIGLYSQPQCSINMKATQMDYDAIVAAGIDVEDEANLHIVKTSFVIQIDPDEEPITGDFYVNEDDETVLATVQVNNNPTKKTKVTRIASKPDDPHGVPNGIDASPYGFTTIGDRFRITTEDKEIDLWPLGDGRYLLVENQVKWLKEIFDVRLIVVNQSVIDTMTDTTAELSIPAGLSFAAGIEQNPIATLGDIAPGAQAQAHWYLRGDAAGSYGLAVDVMAKNEDFGDLVTGRQYMPNALEVLDDNDLQLSVSVPKTFTVEGKEKVTITLTNTSSERTYYGVSSFITHLKEFELKHLQNGEIVENVIVDEQGELDGEFANNFGPGDQIVIEVYANLLINSDILRASYNDVLAQCADETRDNIILRVHNGKLIKDFEAELAEYMANHPKDGVDAFINELVLLSDACATNPNAVAFVEATGLGSVLIAFEQSDEPAQFVEDWYNAQSDESIVQLTKILRAANQMLANSEQSGKALAFDTVRDTATDIPVALLMDTIYILPYEKDAFPLQPQITVGGDSAAYYGVSLQSKALEQSKAGTYTTTGKLGSNSVNAYLQEADLASTAGKRYEITAVQGEITAFDAKDSSGELVYTVTTDNPSAFTITTANSTAQQSANTLSFTGEGTVSVVPETTEGGDVVIEDSLGNTYTYHINVTQAHECTPGERQILTTPTETTNGLAVNTCSVCGEVLSVEVLDAAVCEHSFTEWVNELDADCTEEGVQYRECTNCGKVEMQMTQALGHDFGEWTVTTDPTCTEAGEETRTCSRDASHTETRTVEALGHRYETVVTAPTCEAEGFTTYTCSVCGDSYVADTVEALGHDFGEWTVTTAPTCTEAGEETRICTRDASHTETRTVEALGHRYEAVVTAPTCEAEGFTTYTCSVCGDSYVADTVEALGHDFGEWVVTTAPTCTEAGEETRTCTRDASHTETRAVEALGHRYETVVTAPTCEAEGFTTYTCSVCGDSYVADTVEALGHDFGEWVVTTAPTCTEAGEETRTCTRDASHSETRAVEALGHSYKAAVTAPTCEAEGFTTHTCTRCEDSYTDTPVAALGHEWSNWSTTAEPTCTEAGEQSRVCTRDASHIETKPIAALGHDFSDNAQTCKHGCGTTNPEYLPPQVEPQAPGAFVMTEAKTRAGKTITVDINIARNPGITALSIDIVYPQQLTLTNVEYSSLFSSAPSNSNKYASPFTISWYSSGSMDENDTGLFATLTFTIDEGVPAGDYPVTINYDAENIFNIAFEDQAFDITNGLVKVVDSLPGDVNSDGKVNMKDIVLLQQFINHWEVTIDDIAANVNGDSKINMKDLVLIQQYINGWEVELR